MTFYTHNMDSMLLCSNKGASRINQKGKKSPKGVRPDTLHETCDDISPQTRLGLWASQIGNYESRQFHGFTTTIHICLRVTSHRVHVMIWCLIWIRLCLFLRFMSKRRAGWEHHAITQILKLLNNSILFESIVFTCDSTSINSIYKLYIAKSTRNTLKSLR